MNINKKLNNYLKITGIINNAFKPKKALDYIACRLVVVMG
jgi:hypothetical protein